MAGILQTIFKFDRKICVSFGTNWQYFIICSDNSLAPNMRQAIAWINDDPVQRLYASPDLSVLSNVKYGIKATSMKMT